MSERLTIANSILASLLVVDEMREARGKPKKGIIELCRQSFVIADTLRKYDFIRGANEVEQKPPYLRPIGTA